MKTKTNFMFFRLCCKLAVSTRRVFFIGQRTVRQKRSYINFPCLVIILLFTYFEFT